MSPLSSPQRVQSLFKRFVELNSAMREMAHELRDSIVKKQMHRRKFTSKSISSIVNQDAATNENQTERSQSSIETSKGEDGPETTPLFMKFVETMSTLPGDMNDETLTAYFSTMKDIAEEMSVYSSLIITDTVEETSRAALVEKAADPESATGSTPTSIQNPTARSVEAETPSAKKPRKSVQKAKNLNREPAVKELWTAIEPVLDEQGFVGLSAHGDPKAVLLVHLVKTKMPVPKGLVIYHQGFDMTVMRDINDEYAVVLGPIPVVIEAGVVTGKFTLPQLSERGVITEKIPVDVEAVGGLEIEYREGTYEGHPEPQVSPSRTAGSSRERVQSNSTSPTKSPPTNQPEPSTSTISHEVTEQKQDQQQDDVSDSTTEPDLNTADKNTETAAPAIVNPTKKKTNKRGREEEQIDEKARKLPSRVKRQKVASGSAAHPPANATTSNAIAGPSQSATHVSPTPIPQDTTVRRSRRILKQAPPPVAELPPTRRMARATGNGSKGKATAGKKK